MAVHPFKCKLPDGSVVGSSYDNLSAVMIASSYFAMLQQMSPQTGGVHAVTVYDASDVAIAVIGKEAAPTQTAPADPVPTLASLQPDSSGNWSTEVVLSGSNFLPTSEILANGTPVTTKTYISATELRCVVPASAAGPYQVTVRNGSQTSNALTFTAL